MASMTFPRSARDGHGPDAGAPESRASRWNRYGGMAAVAAAGVAILAGMFGILDHQRKVYGDVVKGEVAPLVAAMVEMDKRLNIRIDEMDTRLNIRIDEMEKRLVGKIDDTNRRLDETNQRIAGLAKDVSDINIRVGRLEGPGGRR